VSPVVLREGKFTIIIYTRDHPPAHVHAKSGAQEAKIGLDPIDIMENWGFKPQEIRTIVKIIQTHQQELLARWDELYSER